MKLCLTNSTKERIIREIRHILYGHPRYRPDSENVYNKYSFKERRQRGVIVNGTSADRVRLSADNYMGRLSSFCMLAPVGDHPGTTIEWVRENFNVLERVSMRRDVFPTPPGVYAITVKSLPDEARGVPGQFEVQPILTQINEPLITFTSSGDSEAQVSRDNIYPGSLRLWLDGRRPLVEDVDYSIDYSTGAVTFLRDTPTGMVVYADYRYRVDPSGPFPFEKEKVNLDAVPGVVLAFGDRCQDGDQMAVVITDERTDVAEVYGGKYEVSFDLIAFSRDSEDREKLSDYIIIKFLEIQNALGYEGIELVDIAPGGENEDVYNAGLDEYYYESTIHLSVRVDWEVYVPLPVVVSRAEMTSKASETEHGYLDGTYVLDMLKLGGPLDVVGFPGTLGGRPFFERLV